MENKNIVLQHMEISQFKGVRQLALDFAPEENSLYGANATGKTTVYDALLWLLFDKDSAGSSKFTVKPIDATQGVTPTVTACFLVDGQPLKLQKTLREKWEKHRGGESRFAGDTREYFVDDVPRKETEYKRIVSSYINEKQFKLLTNLYAFARDTSWKDRRALLEELCSLPSDYEIASGASQFTALLEVLRKCSIIDYKTKLLNERKGINAKLNTLPIRIDECERQITPLTTLPFQQAKENLPVLQSALQQAQTELACLDGDALLSQAINEKRSLETDLRALELENRQCRAAQNIPIVDPRETLKEELSKRKGRLESLNDSITDMEREIQTGEKYLHDCRQKWVQLKKENPVVNTDCPTCGQTLPQEKIKAIQEKMEREKQSHLQELERNGVFFKKRRSETLDKLTQRQKDISELAQECVLLEEQIDALPEPQKPVIQDLPHYQEQKLLLTAKLEEKAEQINRLQTDKQAERDALKGTIDGLQEEIRTSQLVVSQEQQLTDTRRRIEELQQEKRATAAKLDEIDGNIDLCDTFAQYKANLMEDRVNSRFRLAKFRMFRQLVNGGLEDCCEITVDGVPYPDLNNAMKINVGLDCITALSEHFGVRVPLFVDNAESVTKLLDMPSQRIRLIVSEADKELRLA